jgi:hypothetical protein
MLMSGADADALEAMATQMVAAADQFDRTSKGLRGQLYSIVWRGKFCENFRLRWDGKHMPNLQSSSGFLRDSAEVLRSNARQQREASQSSSAVVGVQGSSPSLPGAALPLQGSSPNLQGPGAPTMPVRPHRDLRDPENIPKHSTSVRRFEQPLFTGPPVYTTVAQGTVGDCYFVAAIAALARSNPEAIRQMIHDNGDGTYTVTFSGGRSVMVDDELYVGSDGNPQYGQVGSDGSKWFAIIEKGYAELRGGYDDLNLGGSSATGIEDLLGFATPLSTHTYDQDFTWAVLSDEFAAGRPVVVGTGSTVALDGLVPSHAYMVEGVRVFNGVRQVQLFNPHGFNGDPGNLGRFTVSYDTFLANFAEFSVPQGDLPAALSVPGNIA